MNFKKLQRGFAKDILILFVAFGLIAYLAFKGLVSAGTDLLGSANGKSGATILAPAELRSYIDALPMLSFWAGASVALGAMGFISFFIYGPRSLGPSAIAAALAIAGTLTVDLKHVNAYPVAAILSSLLALVVGIYSCVKYPPTRTE